ncbi:MAG TPA: alpha-L-fucosidase C-terminal domain-containing protein, partial [Bryobacteraceae bacterium]|nr:alpha-L-fucosidase C-terminal domain-containing protein [Bryobacteraceae bacterium]
LLDIGPRSDGMIPVIMEERLTQIGDWLKVNGDAIYGTKPWTRTRQWSTGEVPKVNYNEEFNAQYDVTKLTEPQPGGKASIEAFFTAKGNNIYAILPHWPAHTFTLRDFDGSKLKSVSLLGAAMPIHWRTAGNSVVINLPDMPEHLMKQPAWVLKLVR